MDPTPQPMSAPSGRPDREAERAWARGAWVGFALLLALLALLPWVLPGYRLFTLSYMAVFAIVGVGMHLLVADTGQVSLGHAGFLAIGAYTTVLTMGGPSVPLPLALLAAGLVTAFFGFLLGLPALRLSGPYLAIATLGFGLSVTQIIGRAAPFGGHMGLVMPPARIGPLALGSDASRYYLVVGVAVLATAAARNLSATRAGRAFRAVRDSEVAAAAAGVHVARHRVLAFTVSAALTGVAGGLLALVTGFISPAVFTFTLSLMFLAMVVIGGLGSIGGAVLGSLVMGWLSLEMDAFQDLPLLGDALAAFSDRFMSPGGLPYVGWVATGLLIVATCLLEPRGLHGVWLRLRGRATLGRNAGGVAARSHSRAR